MLALYKMTHMGKILGKKYKSPREIWDRRLCHHNKPDEYCLSYEDWTWVYPPPRRPPWSRFTIPYVLHAFLFLSSPMMKQWACALCLTTRWTPGTWCTSDWSRYPGNAMCVGMFIFMPWPVCGCVDGYIESDTFLLRDLLHPSPPVLCNKSSIQTTKEYLLSSPYMY